MDNKRKSDTAGQAANGRERAGKSASSVFCLCLCLFMLLAAAFASAPLGNKEASANVESALSGLDQHLEKRLEELDSAAFADVDECWLPLMERLRADGMHGADVAHWFSSLPDPYSQRPMGVKVSTLFKRRFVPPYFAYFNKPVQPVDIYNGVVNQDNIKKCYDFLQEHADIFQKAEDKYFVPKEILVSLLMVETRLGNFMGSEKAFWSLACMASANKTSSIDTYLERLPVTEAHENWLGDILKARSDWAYTELKALILYCRLHEHDPLQIKGSIYGAIGLCQFMPSNISFYAVDGNGDGKIDLFALEDAVPSAANFLKTHGWRKNTTESKRVKLLKYYNHSTAYANTIIGLSDGVITLAQIEAKKQAENRKPGKNAALAPAKKS